MGFVDFCGVVNIAIDNTIKVLVAEDDNALRSLLVKLLRWRGYYVLGVDNGEKAVEEYNKHSSNSHGSFNTLLFDVNMPYMKGTNAYLTIRELNPKIPVVFCTSFSEAVEPYLNDDLVYLLPKPFRIKDFRELFDALEKRLYENDETI